jgi:lipid A 3-O-deacylase
MKFQGFRHGRICAAIQVFFCAGMIINAFFPPSRAWSKDPSELQTIQIFYENDLFSGTDEYSTNAVQITWVSQDLSQYEDDRRLPKWAIPVIKTVPFSGNPNSIHNVGILFGQQLFTPSDTQTISSSEEDRPYAGYLYGGLALHSKTDSKLDTLEIVLGVVGPAAKGEQAQNTIHDLRDIPTAKGWDNQLHNEPAVSLAWQRKWRLHSMALFDRLSYDLISHAGAGISAPVIKGSTPCKKSFGAHLFVSTQVEAVFHDIFLDGNTWQDSQSVDKKPLVADRSFLNCRCKNLFLQLGKIGA